MEELACKVKSCLQNSPYMTGVKFTVLELDKTIILQGTTKTYYQKQMAQEEISKILPKDQIFRNELEVKSNSQHSNSLC